jgi:hypothetical protein
MSDSTRRVKMIEGQTATGLSPAHRLVVPSGTMTLEASFTEGTATSCTALTIELLGSVTGTNYFALASHTFTSAERSAKCAMFHVVDKPVIFIQTNITALTKTGGSDVAVTISILSA